MAEGSKSSHPLSFAAFLWPALAAEGASELASAVASELAGLALGPSTEPVQREPEWATPNAVALELPSVRLRNFSRAGDGTPSLICAPYALHGATVADFAPGHSLVGALQEAGLRRLFVTDWRSARPQMRFFSIDTYLADLNVLVDEIGGTVDLIGLCQGGWLALIYAARFPSKVRKLVIAGAPIDNAVGGGLTALARDTPLSVFKQLVELGHGRMLGGHALQFWAPDTFDQAAVHRLLQSAEAVDSPALQRLEARFRDWYAWTVDLPGVYYLEVVERLFKENGLAAGRLTALGRRIDLSAVTCPLFLLAAREDELVAPEQLSAAARLVGTPAREIRSELVGGGHLGLFMGRDVLTTVWPGIAHWLVHDGRGRCAA